MIIEFIPSHAASSIAAQRYGKYVLGPDNILGGPIPRDSRVQVGLLLDTSEASLRALVVAVNLEANARG
jgi:hypothetical protein